VDVFFNALPLTLLMTFFPSIAEDILTRGYLLGHIKIIRPIFWVLLSATLYVLNHIWRLTDGLPVLSYLFLLGLVLGVCVIARKSLWLAFGIHWGSNIAFTLSGKGIDLKTTGDPMGPTWALAISWGLLLLVLGWWYKSDLKKSSQ
ncbi:MAG: CPBP family intramembrane metalloprotease, partial [Ferruginibacter sp.]|nr:CPBP family intramembrane metalloprotease [Ferruginibacter sp.]